MQPSPARDVNIQRTEPLISPVDLVKELPLTPEVEATVLEGRRQIQAVLRGDDPRFLVIVGPCSIHDEKAALDYAVRLKKLSDEISDHVLLVMRVYFEKPRTTLGWKGLVNDPHLDGSFDVSHGLYKARKLLIDLADMVKFVMEHSKSRAAGALRGRRRERRGAARAPQGGDRRAAAEAGGSAEGGRGGGGGAEEEVRPGRG